MAQRAWSHFFVIVLTVIGRTSRVNHNIYKKDETNAVAEGWSLPIR